MHTPCPTLANINFAPSVSFGQTAATAVTYVVDDGWYDAGDLSVRFYRFAQITGVGASATYDCYSDQGFVSVPTCYNFNQAGASQPNGCAAIATNSYGITCPPVVRNGKIWFTHSAGDPTSPCPDPATSPPATKASVYWVEQDPANIIPGVADQFGVVSDPTTAYFFPSLAVNSCDTVMPGFSGSGPGAGQFPSGMYTARMASDPPNTMQAIGTVKAGEGNYVKTFGGGRNRWGDYSYTCVDPADDQTMWTIQEYARSGGTCTDNSGFWGTWWASMPTSCCITLGFSPNFLPDAVSGGNYNQTLTATGGTGPYTWSIASGALPPRLSLSGNGVISGRTLLTANGIYNFMVKATDAHGCSTTKSYSVRVRASSPSSDMASQ